MSIVLSAVAYLCVAVFIVAVIARIRDYLRKPIHVRWELYPVAHDRRASYGGSYLEEVDWWKKEPEKSMAGELKVMVPEILLLKAVFEHNRSLWWVTYPFHLGLYLVCAFLGLQVLGALLLLAGVPVASGVGGVGGFLAAVASVIGPAGMILGALGALGLFLRRMLDAQMRMYSSVGHYFNLILFIVALGLGLASWWTVDRDLAGGRLLLASLIAFRGGELPDGLMLATTVVGLVLVAYVPLTHMSHFFMKYFLYHDIRWGDEANIRRPATDAKIATVLNYPVSWAAAHIAGDGKKTWAEVATFNPMRPGDKDPK